MHVTMLALFFFKAFAFFLFSLYHILHDYNNIFTKALCIKIEPLLAAHIDLKLFFYKFFKLISEVLDSFFVVSYEFTFFICKWNAYCVHRINICS